MNDLRPPVASLVGITPLVGLVTYLGIDSPHLEPLQLLVYVSAIFATSFLFVMDEILEQ